MPIFEYKCSKCNHTYEELTFGDAAKSSCPKCKSTEVEKLFSTFAAGHSHGSHCQEGGCCKTDGASACGFGGAGCCSGCGH